MPIQYTFIEHPPVLHLRYSGQFTMQTSLDAVAEYSQNPKFVAEMPHLIDLSGIHVFTTDHKEFIEAQIRLLEQYGEYRYESTSVFLAPTPAARQLAAMATNMWSEVPGINLRTVEDIAHAAVILGLPDSYVDSLAA
ncbi:hypothetical protein [Pseudooctadecabacter jejudonensis]|uniref:STAS domain-containing protein n=1 Tax=Pseudooctadecabacter jejudonensis TaxID=1391910 RepID=A0A1Y5RAA4_9RHOB|nr:hypothetical protein [Pseudooctadecabacter jejudonensis]SLN12070.1 hypothetical protein PSJ8397_00141 [Pseudooctadecabacter jejudonensis]